MAMSSKFKVVVTLVSNAPHCNVRIAFARFIVPEANELPSSLASTAVVAKVVVSTLNSIRYHCPVFNAELSDPICVASSWL